MIKQRANLHIHSCFSEEKVNQAGILAKKILGKDPLHPVGTPETIYKTLKKRGMTIFTLTDHNSIKGCLKFKEKINEPNFVFGSEIKTTIKKETVSRWSHNLIKEDVKMDVGVYGEKPSFIEEAIDLRDDFFEFTNYLKKQRKKENIYMYQLMHPSWSPNKGYIPLVLSLNIAEYFKVLEIKNGRHPNTKSIEKLANMLNKGITSGSDSHYYKNAATNWNEVEAKTTKEFFRKIELGECFLYGKKGNAFSWVEEGYPMILNDLKKSLSEAYKPRKTARSIFALVALLGIIPVGCHFYNIYNGAKIKLNSYRDKKILNKKMPSLFEN